MKYSFILDIWKRAWCCNWSINYKSKYTCMNTLRHNACTKHTVYVPSSISEISNMFWNIISAFFPHLINWGDVSGVMYLYSRFSHVLPNHLHEDTQRYPQHKPAALWIYSHRQQYLCWFAIPSLPLFFTPMQICEKPRLLQIISTSVRNFKPAWKVETKQAEWKAGQAEFSCGLVGKQPS